eukprot:CAMPEP_0202817822 /NCGR_PEP_ID=MMETSP1389-20130828/7921_1 /ASSEMBLY_ACC=CAM_ASM_000865 /TAXON_ID=302021 /ORGANISM="Rhodomonas sp., Strain CCMP768" /LENGTH=103 /DNA_ID=CAMNT_0049490099 /DNA_START=239 /DNA_END=550 /DNA_ORIENTATION=-
MSRTSLRGWASSRPAACSWSHSFHAATAKKIARERREKTATATSILPPQSSRKCQPRDMSPELTSTTRRKTAKQSSVSNTFGSSSSLVKDQTRTMTCKMSCAM